MCSDHYESLVILFYSTVYVSSFDKRRSSNAISFALIFHPKNEFTPPSLFQFSKVCNSALDIESTSSSPHSTRLSNLFRMTPHLSKSVQKQKTTYKSQYPNHAKLEYLPAKNQMLWNKSGQFRQNFLLILWDWGQ